MDPGGGQNTVGSLQRAVKYLVKSKEVMAADVNEIEIYPLDINKDNYESATPLGPDDKLPSGSTQKTPIFIHAPREKQELTPEEQRLYANPKPASPKKNKPMARPPAGQLIMKPKKKKPEKIEVTVRCADGKQFKAMVDPKHTISDLKDQFEGDSGVPADNQNLFLDGTELEDPKTAADCGIKNGDIIDLEPKTIEVLVRTPDGTTIPVRMKPSDKIQYIKENVAPKTGIEVPQQILKHNGKELSNDKSATDEGLKDGDIIDLMPRTIQINVITPEGATIPVHMKPSDTIQFIKEDIAPQTGVPVPEQVLLKQNGKELSNSNSADDEDLKDGDTIYLQPNTIQVKVKTPDGNLILVTMKPLDTVEFIKRKVEPETGIKVNDQVLKHKGKELPDANTAKDLGLKNGDIIDLMPVEPETILVNVRTPSGSTIPVNMKPSDAVKFIKEKVAKPSGIDVPNQVLKFKGDELDDGKSAEEQGLTDGCIVDLVQPYEAKPMDMSVQKCYYQLDDTIPYYIRINGWEKVGMLKERILETRGGRNCPYLDGVTDASVLKVYPVGQTAETGTPLGAEETIPTGTSFDVPLIVLK